jgi:hypothetical protein
VSFLRRELQAGQAGRQAGWMEMMREYSIRWVDLVNDVGTRPTPEPRQVACSGSSGANGTGKC